uniref:Nuclear-interacting partner of ALK-like n=1 Tax=Saccoglossus kowalevskii TaxID=10224 RepID=A0ABM0H014_SACKO|nr:PREDICTED: nuclear-interacting partner of ALK-like [Saccoglossus kowalevskii]
MTSEEQPTVDSSVESSDADSAQEPSMKKRKISESKKSAFNPITEHRAWCPWVISYVMQQSDDHKSSPVPTYNNIPGWQAVFTLLAPKTSPLKENIQRLTDKDQTPPNQVWKAVRKILSFW